VNVGQTATFTVVASGTAPLSYQWKRNGTTLSGATSSSYTTPATTTADSGATFTVTISNTAGNVTSNPATLTVNATIPLMPLISRSVPAYASAGTATDGNSSDYLTPWSTAQASGAWLAYDLSSVAASSRASILTSFTCNGADVFNFTVLGNSGYGVPGPYLIEGNTAAGGGTVPAAGWTTLVTGPNPQPWKCRQHLINFTGYNWIRFRSLRDDPTYNLDGECSIKFDVYNIANGVTDDWIFFGDSITGEAWHRGSQFSVRVNASKPSRFPGMMGAGIAFLTSSDGAALVPSWLADFPGRYVALSFGTNDANGVTLDSERLATIYSNFETMVKAVLAAGKVPIIPTVIWSPLSQNQANLQQINLILGVRPTDNPPPVGSLRAKYPEIVPGPDLYGTFKDHPEWFGDDLHPNDAGYSIYQQAWADWAVATFYCKVRSSECTSSSGGGAMSPITTGIAGAALLLKMIGDRKARLKAEGRA
jgi:lysophospholipase L1-like esterase